MSESRWAKYSKRAGNDALGFSSFLKEAKDQPGANPTGTGIETPGEKAARLGLQSDGHGSYIDPQTGKIVARTVNGELVFYDEGPTGGATSDGEGGGDNVSSSGSAAAPTYRDPDTGMVTVPSAKPESPAELAAVPDPVPATAPAGYSDHVEKKKELAKKKGERSSRLSKAMGIGADVDPKEVELVAKALSGGKWERMSAVQRNELKKKAKETIVAKKQKEAEEESIQGRRGAVDDALAAGRDPAVAHELVHGHDPADADSNASLAASLARITKTGGPAKVKADKDSNSLLAQDKAETEKEETGQVEPEGDEEIPAGLDGLLGEIMAEDDTDINNVEEINQASAEKHMSEREKMIQEYKNNILESFTKQDEEIDSAILPIRDGINEIIASNNKEGNDLDSMRDQYAGIVALASTYSGRVRHGEGKRTMVYDDAQILMNPEVQKSLLEGYGDGSPEQIKKFVESRKIVNTPDAVVEKMWKVLPKEFKSALSSGSMGTTLSLLDEKDGKVKKTDIKNEHYAGKDKRSANGSADRKKLLLKLFLDQGGRDGYTGLPLDPRYMELEHVRGLQTLGDGEVAPTMEQIRQRENVDNWLWIATGVNNEKSDKDMESFLDATTKKHGGKTRADYVDLEASDAALAKRNSGISSLLDGMFENKQFSSSVTPDSVNALFENELAESKAMHRNGIKKTPINMGNAMRQQLGMVKDQKLTRSQVKTSKELFRPIITKIINSGGDKRQEMVKQYNDLFHAASDKTLELGGMGEDAKSDPNAVFKTVKGKTSFNEKATWEQLFYKSLAEAGLLDKEIIDKTIQPKEAEKFKKIIYEGYVEQMFPNTYENWKINLG